MGKVTIHKQTTNAPISLIGEMAGVCWGADTTDLAKNYKRGISCLEAQHGRTFEFPDVYMTLDGYSARVIREWYTHIGGSPTRLQASTRYIDYGSFEFVVPPSIDGDAEANYLYYEAMRNTQDTLLQLIDLGIPREDAAMLLPQGMQTKIVCKHNLRNLIDMSHQRMCTRAYHEYRRLFGDVCKALSDYSEEWAYLVEHYFIPKCEYMGFCKEAKSCGRAPRRGER